MLELIILGSGTGIPAAERGAPGLVVKVGDKPLLFDSGSGILGRLLQAGVNPLEIDHLFYTHQHIDHVADLAPFLHAATLTSRERLLEIVGPQGFKAYYNRLLSLHPSLRPRTFGVNLWEVCKDRLTYPTWSVLTELTGHTAHSVGYRVQTDGGSIVYSGDATYSQNLVELSREADLLVLECSYPDDQQVAGHLTPSLAGRIAEEAEARQLILTHLYPPCDRVDVVAQCRRVYAGPILLAHDLMRLRIDKPQ